FFGNSWPIPFKENAQTLPSIGVKLDPPEDPLPQVSAEIQLREHARMRLEEGLMGRLEDEFNRQLDLSQTQIQTAIDRAMRVFDSQNVLRGVIRGSMLPLTSRRKAIKATQGSYYPQNVFKQGAEGLTAGLPIFRQFSSEVELKNQSNTSNHTLLLIHYPKTIMNYFFRGFSSLPQKKNGPVVSRSAMFSFLSAEEHETSKTELAFANLGAALNPPPAVKIQYLPVLWISNRNFVSKNQITDIREPDKKIKQKLDEIEQLRTDEEVKLFEQAASEFSQLTKITIQGKNSIAKKYPKHQLERNIQIQMNPFLVDVAAVTRQVDMELPRRSRLQRLMAFRQRSGQFSNINDSSIVQRLLLNICKGKQERKVKRHLKLSKPINPSKKLRFLKCRKKFILRKVNQSVCDATSRTGKTVKCQDSTIRQARAQGRYPTVDELVSDMEKKRDATERLVRSKPLRIEITINQERVKILELQLKLLKAQNEMIRDALHSAISRVIAQYEQAIETIKTEVAVEKLR
ncbi:putative blood stage antigen 41-3 precursor, partial [Cardiosporidium cionae]